ncbi:MAG: glycosyltransferase family 4 protein, partial [Cyclobacteriaceae bacterium]
MRIGMVLDNTFPPDSRVENEAVSLTQAGHEVFLFCLRRKNEPEREDINGIKVIRYGTNTLEYKLSALAYTIPLYHFLMGNKIRKFINDANPDVLHVHDIAIARAAFEKASKFDIDVVLDLHENRPVIMKEYVHLKKWPGKQLISPSVWDRFQGEFSRRARHLIVVTEEAADDLSQTYSIPRNKITVVPNTVSLNLYMEYR